MTVAAASTSVESPDGFHRGADGILRADGADLREVAARFGTPCYVYSRATLEQNCARALDAFSPAGVFYAVKANGNLSLLRILARMGAGFDVVSGGELARALAAGGRAERVVFSGVGKSRAEIEFALTADETGVGCINAESAAEVERIAEVASALGVRAKTALRVIPDVDAGTHRHLTTGLSGGKFGVPMSAALDLARRISALEVLDFAGLSCHLGSQIRDAKVFDAAAAKMAALAKTLEAAGMAARQVDMGGGFAAAYGADESPCDFSECARVLFSHFDSSRTRLLVEPGRSIVAAAGILLSRVEYVKSTGDGGSRVIVADAGMNDLLRPALYDARHRIVRVVEESGATTGGSGSGGEMLSLVAGPVCESADILGRVGGLEARAGDLLAVLDAGAYGMVMASNYNARCRPCEVLSESGEVRLIRRRETVEDMLGLERG